MFAGTITNPDFARMPRTVFGRQQATETPEPPPSKVRTKAESRRQQAAKTAAELFRDLPEPGESVHALLTGNFDLGAVIVSIVDRLPQCSALRVATLCYNRRVGTEMLGLLERRPDLKFTLLVSDFFRNHNKDLHAWFREELKAYPTARVAHGRSHAKIACFDLGPADGMVIESSANLRTNRNRETATAIRSRPLHDFHSEWIDSMVVNCHEQGETPEG